MKKITIAFMLAGLMVTAAHAYDGLTTVTKHSETKHKVRFDVSFQKQGGMLLVTVIAPGKLKGLSLSQLAIIQIENNKTTLRIPMATAKWEAVIDVEGKVTLTAQDINPKVTFSISQTRLQQTKLAAVYGSGDPGWTYMVDLPTYQKVAALGKDGAAGLSAKEITALGKVGIKDKRVVPLLIRAMKDDNGNVRLAAAYALDHIRMWRRTQLKDIGKNEIWPTAKEFVPPLLDLVDDKYDHIRHAAVHCLGRIGPQAASTVKRLVALYWKGTLQDRLDVLLALSWIAPDDPAVIKVFLDAIKHKDPVIRVRAAATMYLVKVDPAGKGIEQALINATKDSDPRVRKQATTGLELVRRTISAKDKQ